MSDILILCPHLQVHLHNLCRDRNLDCGWLLSLRIAGLHFHLDLTVLLWHARGAWKNENTVKSAKHGQIKPLVQKWVFASSGGLRKAGRSGRSDPVCQGPGAPGHQGEDPPLLHRSLEPSEGYAGRAALSFPGKTLWEEHLDRVSVSGSRENALSWHIKLINTIFG